MTLDLIYQVPAPPQSNQKLVASDYLMAAGGPATNAAITFHQLNQLNQLSMVAESPPSATILTVLGAHPIGQLVQSDVMQQGVAIADLNPHHSAPLPTSSIMVTATTGERAVVSRNAVNCQATADQIPASLLDRLGKDIGIVLIDGHQMEVGEAIAAAAHHQGIPVVVDGGSWKPGFEQVLQHADYVICSANFFPPGCTTSNEVYAYLRELGVSHIAITHGANPIEYWSPQTITSSFNPIPVPQVKPIDTLGAGDIFHGAFCHYLLEAILDGPAASSWREASTKIPLTQPPLEVPAILAKAANVASHSCQQFGPRGWIQTFRQ